MDAVLKIGEATCCQGPHRRQVAQQGPKSGAGPLPSVCHGFPLGQVREGVGLPSSASILFHRRGSRGAEPRGSTGLWACLPLSVFCLLPCMRQMHTKYAWVGFQGLGCVLSFKPIFFYSFPRLVTVLVITSLFSWRGRLHLVLESDSCLSPLLANSLCCVWGRTAVPHGHRALV